MDPSKRSKKVQTNTRYKTIISGNSKSQLTSTKAKATKALARNCTKAKAIWLFFHASWVSEIIYVFVTSLTVVAIAILLKSFDGKPISEWNFRISTSRSQSVNISLNFVVSILGTLSKALLAIVLSRTVSQTKWNWFIKMERPLHDFETFSSASRGGPMGSIELMWKMKAKHLASLGALITLLTLTLDPFFQLLIAYPGDLQAVPDPSATIAHASSLNKGIEQFGGHSGISFTGDEGDGFRYTYTSPDWQMVAAVSSGLWSVQSRQTPNYNCRSGNCTWPAHVSLAMCSACFDVGRYLNVTSGAQLQSESIGSSIAFSSDPSVDDANNTIVTLRSNSPTSISISNPNGFQNTSSGNFMALLEVEDPSETYNFKDSETLLLAVSMLRPSSSYLNNLTKWEETTVQATECGLLLCSNTYSSEVQNGKFSETITSSHSKRFPSSYRPVVNGTEVNQSGLRTYNDSWNPMYHSNQYDLPRNDYQIQLSDDQKALSDLSTFNITQGAIDSLHDYLTGLIQSPDDGSDSRRQVYRENGVLKYLTPAAQAIWQSDSLNATFENLAVDLSAAIRNSGNSSATSTSPFPALEAPPPQASSDGLAQPEQLPEALAAPLTGFSHQYVVRIVIRWPFLVVPTLVCVLSALLLIGAMYQTRSAGTPLWKEKELPALVWGLDHDSKELARKHWRGTRLSKKQKLKARFKIGKDGEGELSATK